jgi:hypothetical protein
MTDTERNARVARADRVLAAFFRDKAETSTAIETAGLRNLSLNHDWNDDDLLSRLVYLRKGCNETDTDSDFDE